MATLLEIDDLRVVFDTQRGVAPAVDGVSLTIDQGEAVALVGESGCGKSVTALSIMKLVPSPPGRIERGKILFEGTDLAAASEEEMRRFRGNDIAMIFQEPMTSLNPVLTVGFQISEALMLHRGMSKAEAIDESVRMLELVEMPDARERTACYPHQLSGGMRQRVMIAMALSCEPKLLIADEPTTALDVTIQAQIMDLLSSLREKLGMSVLFITHDLGVVAEHMHRVVVMYAGRVVEHGLVDQVFGAAAHPYTQGLMRSVPRLGATRGELDTIPGMVPPLTALPSGCRFRDRCPVAEVRCATEDPQIRYPVLGAAGASQKRSSDHGAACLLAFQEESGG